MRYWIGVVIIAIATIASASFLVFGGSGGTQALILKGLEGRKDIRAI